MRLSISALVLAAACVLQWTAAGQTPDGFDAANRLYDQGNYEAAATAYRELIRSGADSAAVYYNLGNALLKSGQLGRAVAVYRTQETSTPRDPDLRANLGFALAQVKGPSVKPSAAAEWLRRVSVNEWTMVTAAGFWVALLLLALQQARPPLRGSIRPWVFGVATATLACAICLVISLRSLSVAKAIVIVSEAPVRQAPIEDATTVFTVHDGAELLVLDRNENWIQVSADPRRTGWMRADQALSGR